MTNRRTMAVVDCPLRVGLARLLFSLMMIIACFPSSADTQRKRAMIILQIQELKNHFTCPNSVLAPTVRVDVFLKGRDDDDMPKTLYTSFFYGNGRCLGSHRRAIWVIPDGEPLEVHIEFADEDPKIDCSTAANAVLRTYVDAQLNNAYAGKIYVPENSFDDFIEAMSHQSVVPYTEAHEKIDLVNLTVISEDQSRVSALTYVPKK